MKKCLRMKPVMAAAVGCLTVGAGAQEGPVKVDPFRGATVGGFSGLFQLPTTSITPDGWLDFGFGTGDVVRRINYGTTGERADNYSAVIGFLPNLEVGLSFLTPSLFNGVIDDRTVGFKYAPLQEGRHPFSFAFGSTDVQGTRKRATDYAMVGKRIGALELYAGATRGLTKGAAGGAMLRLNDRVALMAEKVGDEKRVGMKARIDRRLTLSAAIDAERKPFFGVGYAAPLGSPTPADVYPQTTSEDRMEALAQQMVARGKGRAKAHEEGGWLVASYEDVEARHPVETLMQVLRQCLQYSHPRETKSVSLTVQRFGYDLVTISGPIADIRSFLYGWMTPADFLSSMKIEDGAGPAPKSEAAAKAGTPVDVLVSVSPSVAYRLGIRDNLPNRESILTTAVVKLPANLIAAVAGSVVLNDTLDHSPTLPTPSMALYRTDRMGQGLYTMAGVDRIGSAPASGTLQVAYYPPATPFRLSGTVSQPFESDRKASYAVEGGLEAMEGKLSLWARHERFYKGDVGETVGLTRRYGQTWVSMFALRTRQGDDYLDRVGVLFQLPLPGWSTNVGRIRVATNNIAEFAYRPTLDAQAAGGRGIVRPRVFSPDIDLTARGQLTAWFIRKQIGKYGVKD